MSSLILHRGARMVDKTELVEVQTPEGTRTWKPIAHATVLDNAVGSLFDAGYEVKRTQLSLSRDNARFFGILDLTSPLSPGGETTLVVGLRNSIDKTFPMGFCAGSRVFVCDNLAFSAELMVKRKHTAYGSRNFSRAIGDSIIQLSSFVAAESARIDAMKNRQLSDHEAESLLLRASVKRGILNLADLTAAVDEYHSPRHEEFRPRTAWSLYNAVTETLKSVNNPDNLRSRTMKLGALLAS